MKLPVYLEGFSKLGKEEKLLKLQALFHLPDLTAGVLRSFYHSSPAVQSLIENISENTLSNFHLPFGIAPNFLINETLYHVPMVTEESSVIAAASYAAKFWYARGGFHSRVQSQIKTGQVYFSWKGEPAKLLALFPTYRDRLERSVSHITKRMTERGGGIQDIQLLPMTLQLPEIYQLRIHFDTVNSMGANFINSCLEGIGFELKECIAGETSLTMEERECAIIMAILSNYNPGCTVETWVECDVDALDGAGNELTGEAFAEKFMIAMAIAENDIYRAVTHNKGIMNGIDAVAMATGNDFRALEAGAHAWASRSTGYRSLTMASMDNHRFRLSVQLPLTVGTIGGLTNIHPLAGIALEILGKPDSDELMQIISSVGLASNYAAVRSLITSGIQKGHMRMHLANILHTLHATDDEEKAVIEHFKNKTVSYAEVSSYLGLLRN
jgi:hydroxymethylglutaryl-CoA reductase